MNMKKIITILAVALSLGCSVFASERQFNVEFAMPVYLQDDLFAEDGLEGYGITLGARKMVNDAWGFASGVTIGVPKLDVTNSFNYYNADAFVGISLCPINSGLFALYLTPSIGVNYQNFTLFNDADQGVTNIWYGGDVELDLKLTRLVYLNCSCRFERNFFMLIDDYTCANTYSWNVIPQVGLTLVY